MTASSFLSSLTSTGDRPAAGELSPAMQCFHLGMPRIPGVTQKLVLFLNFHVELLQVTSESNLWIESSILFLKFIAKISCHPERSRRTCGWDFPYAKNFRDTTLAQQRRTDSYPVRQIMDSRVHNNDLANNKSGKRI
jgi:hypothetical protein